MRAALSVNRGTQLGSAPRCERRIGPLLTLKIDPRSDRRKGGCCDAEGGKNGLEGRFAPDKTRIVLAHFVEMYRST